MKNEHISFYEVWFGLTQDQVEQAEGWYDSHQCIYNNDRVSKGLCYKFTPTHIGTVKFVVCLACNKSHNITDYDSW